MVEFNVFTLFSFSLGGLHFHFGGKKDEAPPENMKTVASKPPVLIEKRPIDRDTPEPFLDTRPEKRAPREDYVELQKRLGRRIYIKKRSEP